MKRELEGIVDNCGTGWLTTCADLEKNGAAGANRAAWCGFRSVHLMCVVTLGQVGVTQDAGQASPVRGGL